MCLLPPPPPPLRLSLWLNDGGRLGREQAETELEVVERILPLAHWLALSGLSGAFVRDL